MNFIRHLSAVFGRRPNPRPASVLGARTPFTTGWTLLALWVGLGGSAQARNLLGNPGFERGLDGWATGGTTWTSAATREPVHGGRQAARVSNRTEPSQGIRQTVRGQTVSGETYACSAWVRVENARVAPVSIVLLKTDAGNDGNPSRYVLATANAFSNRWVQLQGNVRLQVTGQLRQLDFSMEGAPAGVNLLVDDVVMERHQLLPWYWPSAGILPVLGGVGLYGLATRRWRLAAWSGVAFGGALFLFGLSAVATLQQHMRQWRFGMMDRSQEFRALGFENVVRGQALEIKDRIDTPTLYQASGVRIYGTCTTNLAIVARVAEIHGRVEGKLYFRGQKLVIMPNAEVVNGLDAWGAVFPHGKIGGPVTGGHRMIRRLQLEPKDVTEAPPQ
jgi:hypothetical protein